MPTGDAISGGKTDVLAAAEPNEPGGGHRAAMVAGFSGWLLDAFDFFLVTFCLTAMARDFHKSDAQIALVITLTLAFRPIGGFVFGMLADRYGRRRPLMINIGVFAVAEVLTGLAPNYTVLLIVRALFGVVMGGQWGWALRWSWRRPPPADGVCSQGCSRRVTPPATYWRRSASFSCMAVSVGARCFSWEACPRFFWCC